MGFGKDGKGVIIAHHKSLTLAALGAKTAFKTGGAHQVTKDFRLIKVKGVAGLADVAPGVPIVFGIASDDLSVAEIAEAIDAENVDPADVTKQDNAERPVWMLGILGPDDDCQAFEETIRWTFREDVGYTFFGYNLNTNTAATTGCILEIAAKCFGVWV